MKKLSLFLGLLLFASAPALAEPYRYSPEGCEFEATFPDEPYEARRCNPDNPAETYPTPLNANDRACRSVNVILLTDGDETCDSQQDAVNAASARDGPEVRLTAITRKSGGIQSSGQSALCTSSR